MIEEIAEQDATTTKSLAEMLSEQMVEGLTPGATVVTLKLKSELYVFDNVGQFIEVKQDGEFVLDIDQQGVVTGTHSCPSPHDVKGLLDNSTTPPNIYLTSVDKIRLHTGALADLGGERFIGLKILLQNKAFSNQEEGVWVGTKIG